MDKDKRDKSILFRMWKSTSKEDAPETDAGEPDKNTSGDLIEEAFVKNSQDNGEVSLTEETAGQQEERPAPEGQEKEPDELMKPEENYLMAVRRGYLNEDADRQTYYSDFMLDHMKPDNDKKAFIHELQVTAKEYLESGSRKGSPKNAVNGQVCIKVSPDYMEVWLFLFPPKNGGRDVNEELIYGALECSNVEYGVDTELIKKMVREKRYLMMGVAARGQRAVDGKEGKVTDHFPRIPYSSAEELDKKTVDFKNLNWLHPVTVGTVICDVTFPVEGRDGSDVTGQVLECKKLRKFVIPYGSNTALNKKNQLVSKIDGTLYFENGKFHVKNVMNILSDVDLSVGNVDTIGNLEIRGDVLSGFSVQATGNIMIHGTVGCSTVIAGGNIKVNMGVKGSRGGFLQAGGDIECSYIENCSVKARGNVTAGSIVNCDVSSDRNVESKVIVGGTVAAMRQVHAKTVGNTQRRQTMFYLGNTQEVRNEKIALESDLELLESSMDKLSKNIRYLQNKEGCTADEEELCEQLQMELKANQMQSKQSRNRLKEINEGITDSSQCEMTANRIYPPATVTISGDACVINREQNMCRIWMDEGEIVLS